MNTIAQNTILVVDDTETNIDIIVETLGDLYEVVVAMDGEDALEIVHEAAPDLILLDIMMPGMDGYEVCQRLKADPETADIPVMFLTGRTDRQDEARGRGLGAADYIVKPFDPEDVVGRVQRQIGPR